MAIEMSAEATVCYRCGRKYGRRKGSFPVSYAMQYKGTGFLHICKDCVDSMFKEYLSQCNDSKTAVRQMCRKLDLYWSETVYDVVERKNTPRSIMTQYISKLNTASYAGKSYDDTLSDEGTLWNLENKSIPHYIGYSDDSDSITSEIPEEVVTFWGSGYSDEMYRELEQRRQYYISKLPRGTELDIGSEVLIRQICNLEVNISKDSAAGKSIDKSVNSLNTLLGSLNLKPAQQKDADSDADMAATPMGVWLYRYENKRPLPEVDEQLKDVNHVKKYVFTWLGHLVKLLGIKNGYSKLYDEEIARLRVEKPEYADEDDEDLLIDSYSDSSSPETSEEDG